MTYLLIGILVLLGLPGITFAHDGDASLVHACVKDSGQVRIVGASQACNNQETPMHWPAVAPAPQPGLRFLFAFHSDDQVFHPRG